MLLLSKYSDSGLPVMVERIYFQAHMVIGGIPFLSGYWTVFLDCYQFHATWTFPIIQLASSEPQSERVSKQDGSHSVLLCNHQRGQPGSPRPQKPPPASNTEIKASREKKNKKKKQEEAQTFQGGESFFKRVPFIKKVGDPPWGSSGLRLCLPISARPADSIPGRGAKIPQASQPRNRKQKQYCNKVNKDFKKRFGDGGV